MSETQQVKTASKPRIGYCIPRMRGHAGWATVSEAGIRALSRYVEPVLFVEQIDEEAVRQKFPGVEYHVLPAVQAETWRDRPFRLLLRMAFSIWRARRLQNLNLNLVHSLEMFPTGWVGDALARKEQVRHVLTAHGTYTVFWMKRPMLEFFYRRILRRASAIFPVSHGTECRLWEFYGKDLGRAAVRTIWNGSDAGGRVPEDWVRNRPLPADPVVFSVGGIKARKGIHVSLRAFSLLQQKFPRARYRIAGVKTDTFYVRNLEEIIRREKIRNVEFLGVVSDEELDRLYRESSIFILLSQEDGMFFEGFGLVFLEAGAYGLPVIGTRSGGIPDVVIDGWGAPDASGPNTFPGRDMQRSSGGNTGSCFAPGGMSAALPIAKETAAGTRSLKMRRAGMSGPPAKLRVAYIAPLLRGRGGWPTSCRGIVQSLRRFVDPMIVAARAEESLARELFPGAEVVGLPVIQPNVHGSIRPVAHMLPTMLALRRLPALGVDLVHSMELFPTGWVGDALAAKGRAPHVVTVHGTYGVIWHRWRVTARLCEGILRRAAAVCPVSNGTAVRMRTRFARALAGKTVRVILQGSEFASRVPRSVAERKEFPAEPAVLSVGGIKPRKGYSVSLRAFAILQRRFPGARYRIVGTGVGNIHHRGLQRIVAAEGIRNAEFLGVVSDEELDRLYRESSIFILLSQEDGMVFEGFGLVYLEAGAYGLPVIGTRSGGIPDAVADGETGFLFRQDDVEGIARAMIGLAENSNLSHTMGLAGRVRAESFTWERFAGEQMEVYNRCLAP
jgi:phosphatidylinositol alpha-1,6-mannosyltransferase